MAKRVSDPKVLHLLQLILKTNGKKGISQGGVISPLLANIYLNYVDKMLERAKEVTRVGKRTQLKYARYADDRSQPLEKIIEKINPILRGWLNYFRIGNSAKCFARIKRWIEKRVRIHLMRAKQRHGFGWKRWSTKEIFKRSGIYNDFKIRYL